MGLLLQGCLVCHQIPSCWVVEHNVLKLEDVHKWVHVCAAGHTSAAQRLAWVLVLCDMTWSLLLICTTVCTYIRLPLTVFKIPCYDACTECKACMLYPSDFCGGKQGCAVLAVDEGWCSCAVLVEQ